MTPSLPPGPRRPALAQAFALWRHPVPFFDDCRRRFGETFTLRLPTRPPYVFFSHPDAVKDIFGGDPDTLRAGEASVILEPILGPNSLLLLDGPRHLRERRLMLPSFHGERMAVYGEIMRSITERAIDRWPIGAAFPIHAEMQQITLDVIFRTVFGFDDSPALAPLRDRLTRLVGSIANAATLMPFMQWDLGPRSPWGRYVRLRRETHELLGAAIEARRNGDGSGDDVLSILLLARDEDGQPMTDAELRDQMITLLLAGHETTATALTWTFHHLFANPAILEHALGELREGTPDELLDAIAKESLRLTPIVPEVGRMLDTPLRIGDWDLPAGVVAAPSIYLAHRRPERWPEPDRFDPERFLGSRPTPYEFFPFGGGVRRCLGMAFALYEMRIVLATILSRVSIRAAEPGPARIVRRSITLAPEGGVPVVVEAR
ncbi:MAG: cytochrome P450 [Candidatus Binatia bacterium]